MKSFEMKKITPKNRNARLQELRKLMDKAETEHATARSRLSDAHGALLRASGVFVLASKDYVDAREAFSLALRGMTKISVKERVEVTSAAIDVKDRRALWSQDDATPHEDTLEKACEKFLGMTYTEVRQAAVRHDDRGEITYYELPDGFVVGSSYPGNCVILGKKA